MHLIGIALAPVWFLFTIVYLWDRHEREPVPRLFLTFFFGILTAIPSIIGEYALEKTTGLATGPQFVETLTYTFVVVALVEEFFKWLVVMVYAYPSKQFNEPYDGIMYAVAVSLGFAAIENIGYSLMEGLEVAILRMFTAVPMHAMCGIIMGYYFGSAKFRNSFKIGYMIIALLAPVLIHGLYDFFLMWEVEFVAYLAFVVLLIGILLGLRALHLHRQRSPFKQAKP